MNKRTLIAIAVVCSFFSVVLLSNVFLFGTSNTDTQREITIVATVLPTRTIIVDKNLTILKIYSNTKDDVRPIVLQDKLDGASINYSDAIQSQYSALKPVINFTQAGLVYQRDTNPVRGLFRKALTFFQKAFSYL